MTAGTRGKRSLSVCQGDTGTIDRGQNGAEGAEVRGPLANGIQCLFATHIVELGLSFKLNTKIGLHTYHPHRNF